MIALLQRVNRASVVIDDNQIASIGSGLLAFIGIERGDNGAQARRMLERLLGYRVFPDDTGRMNRNLREAGASYCWCPNSHSPQTRARAIDRVSRQRRPQIRDVGCLIACALGR